MRNGWLAFQGSTEHRRLLRVPEGWEGESEAGLNRLLVATQVK
jgi:hypothetical protein